LHERPQNSRRRRWLERVALSAGLAVPVDLVRDGLVEAKIATGGRVARQKTQVQSLSARLKGGLLFHISPVT